MRFGAGYLALCAIVGRLCGATVNALDSAQAALVASYNSYASRLPEIAVVVSSAQRGEIVQNLFAQVCGECLTVAPEVLAGAEALEPVLRGSLHDLESVISDDMNAAEYLVTQKAAFARRFVHRRNPPVEHLEQMRAFVAATHAALQMHSVFGLSLGAEMDRWLASPNDLNLSDADKQGYVDRATQSLAVANACQQEVYGRVIADVVDIQFYLWNVVEELQQNCHQSVTQAIVDVDSGMQWVLDRDFAQELLLLDSLNNGMTSDATLVDNLQILLDKQRSMFMTSLLQVLSGGVVGPALRARTQELAAALLSNLGDSVNIVPDNSCKNDCLRLCPPLSLVSHNFVWRAKVDTPPLLMLTIPYTPAILSKGHRIRNYSV